MTKNIIWLFLLFLSIQTRSFSLYADADSLHQYKTRDEKREAAQRYEITDELSFSAIAELEWEHQHNSRVDNAENPDSSTSDFSKSLEIEIKWQPRLDALEDLSSEMVIEYDDQKDRFVIDEAVILLERGETEIELGKIYVPFGEYFSHFIAGSLVEFAETRGKGMVLSHTPTLSENSPIDSLDLALYAYKGKAKREGTSGHAIDWGMMTEISPKESWVIGLGYLSDLADADDISLENNNRYAQRVGGFNAYSSIAFSTEKQGNFELSTEYATALDNFKELATEQNKPSAWNVELAHFPTNTFAWALRFAGSNELEDAPKRQWGIVGTWRMHKKASFTLEYLSNHYKEGFVEDEQEEILESSRQINGRLSIFF